MIRLDINKRVTWLQAVLLFFAGVAKAQDGSILSLRADMKTEQKINLLQRHIEKDHYGDGKKTIPIALPYDGKLTGVLRAWRVSDFKNQSTPSFMTNVKGQPPKVTAADWLNNENSAQFSGGYLLSQVYRYKVTHDKAALVECGRALKGIQAIAALAGPDRFGWICKPFGEKLQDYSSPDQNITIVHGLWAFLPYANTEQAAWIKKMIPAIATYWEKIDYTILSGEHVWDMRKGSTFMRMYKVINLLAYDISKDKKFLDVANRIEAEHGELSERTVTLFDTQRDNRPGYFNDWKRVSEFSINVFAPIQLDILCHLRPEHKKDYLAAWCRALEHSLIGYDVLYGAHYYYIEAKLIDSEYVWRPQQFAWPAFSHEDLLSSNLFAFTRYPHRIYWPDATSRLPLIYLMYLNDGGEPIPYVEKIVRDIMNKLDFEHLHWMVDPHGDQTIPEISFITYAMTSETGNYVAAWYLGKQLGFWKAGDMK